MPGAARVLVVASELPPGPGGIGTHAHALATALQQHGHEVRLLGCQHYVSAAERDSFNRQTLVPVTTLRDEGDPLRTAAARSGQLREAVRSFRPDVIVASGGRILWLSAVAARRSGTPLVAVVHGTELGGAMWQRRLTRRALEEATRVIAVSEFTAGLIRRTGARIESVDVIPNGADATTFTRQPEFGAAFREHHGLGGRPVVLTVGNVTERKGQHLVVDALPALVGRVPDVVYVMAGRPTDGDLIEQRARAAGVLSHVRLLGQVGLPEIVSAYNAADVFAMTSTTTASGDVEGFGIAVIEAALCGLPAVVTSGTGAQEAVRGDETGVVAEPTSSAIADALASLLGDDARRTAMGAEAERRARSESTWSHRAERYSAILHEVARGSRPRIVVVSHTPHHLSAAGEVVGFGPTLRELDHLSTLASELVHVAPLYPEPAPAVALPYSAPNIRYVPVPPAGGPRKVDRLLALRAVPSWARTINREMTRADVAHVRCPAGISMVALGILRLRRSPRDRWVKYAGNWAPEGGDAFTYQIQREWLRRGWARAAVTVNGRWPAQPRWVHAFDNPTLTDTELEAGRRAAESKEPGPPFRVVFSGRLEAPKGADIAVEAIAELRRRGTDVTLDLIGDGPLRPWVEARIEGGLDDVITLHGWLPRAEVERFLARGHVFLLPTTASEGFPKAVAEAIAFGCVPVTTGVSSMGQVLAETGGAIVNTEGRAWADAVERALDPESRPDLVAEGLSGVQRFSYRTYLERVASMAREAWGRELS